ncbi:hypothetical protein EXH44_02335 [Actinobacillus indolicus]|uniref:Factor H binding protein-like C-terminal domain-containing protein n=1 Tax=Actinobacillus indolicus TaxID=51049 RepID=A0A4P7CE41_9PAST|nr:transferrin-binding protein-like solute binding protein [Actinobacillus indolicus]QBQ63153.1 hypothetical protein EXH44_02335 [Actinobacillus indolicus]
MRLSVKTTAMAILVSLGVTACSSGGGGSSASNDNPEQAKQIEVLKKQVEAERQAVKSAQDNANQASEKVKASEAAKAKAEAELAKAQQALKDAENATAEEKAKAQAAAEKATQDLAAAQQAVKDAETATTAEQAKAQAAADKAAQDLAAAQQAVKDAKAATAAEQAKAQAAADKAAQELAIAQQDVEKAKAELAKLQEKQLYWDSTWRYLGGNEPNVSQRVTIGRSSVKIDLSKYPESDDVRQIDVVNDDGINVGKAYFINQAYSSYEQFIPENVSFDTPYWSGNDFVFIPTDANKSSAIQNQITATYTGLALDRNYNNDSDRSGSVTKAKFSLTADFAQNTVEGAITERENGRADIQLEQGVIGSSVANQYIDMPYMGFSGVAKTTRKSGGIRTGEYIGFFAGPDAEEVVGSVNNLGGQTSFGGKRQ